MRLVSVDDGGAIAERRGVAQRIETMLVDTPPPGAFVLVFQRRAIRVLDAVEAARIDAALDAVERVLDGRGDAGALFADLDREPQLPPHLLGCRR